MLKKGTVIRLVQKDNNTEHDFDGNHALELLRYQEEKGYNHYSLPEDSKYEFKDGNLITRSSDSSNKATQKQSADNSGDKA